jgi:hypothetical protein
MKIRDALKKEADKNGTVGLEMVKYFVWYCLKCGQLNQLFDKSEEIVVCDDCDSVFYVKREAK